ncbi:MAG: V-type ATP synthase subunit E [Bacillota bacterium]
MAENAIIEKIVDDAKKASQSYISDANAKKVEIESDFEKYKTAITEKTNKTTAVECENILVRKNTVATLDTNKIILQAKQEVIDNAFVVAKENILKDKSAYQKFMTAEILKYFENGDEIIIGKTDTALDDAFVKGLKEGTSKKIVISKETGNFVGGVIIKSAGYDKNLCLDTILKTKREEIEAQVSRILFE